jgi:hypothetical protein
MFHFGSKGTGTMIFTGCSNAVIVYYGGKRSAELDHREVVGLLQDESSPKFNIKVLAKFVNL